MSPCYYLGVGVPLNIYCILDTQCKPGVRNPLLVVAHDIVAQAMSKDPNDWPQYVIHGGDHWDMPSLSAYDLGKHSFNSRCYSSDIEVGNRYLMQFWAIIKKGQKKNPKWKCKFIILEGNHEFRIHKMLETAPIHLVGALKEIERDYTNWDVVKPFLKPHIINNVAFVHYIANEFSGRAVSTASAGLKARGHSFVAFHKQGLDTAESCSLDGRRLMGVIAGACYYHDEGYKGPQSNHHFRGTLYLRNLYRGEWEMEVRNLRTLDRKHGQKN